MSATSRTLEIPIDHAGAMMRAHPHTGERARVELVRCIRACEDCAVACTACADSCLGEPDSRMLTACIRANLDCADVCQATSRVLSRQTALEPMLAQALVAACALAATRCAAECERHAEHMVHCRICAEACRVCANTCDLLARAVAPAVID